MNGGLDVTLDDKVNKAMHLFWHQGYGGTGVAQLTKETGLSRKAIYSKWGDKQGLFNHCLNLYCGTMRSQMLDELHAKDAAGVDAIKLFFFKFKNILDQNAPSYGCMVVRNINEIGQMNKQTEQIGHEFLEYAKAGIENCIICASNKGTIKADVETKQALEILFGIYIGIISLNNNYLARGMTLSLIEQGVRYIDGLKTELK